MLLDTSLNTFYKLMQACNNIPDPTELYKLKASNISPYSWIQYSHFLKKLATAFQVSRLSLSASTNFFLFVSDNAIVCANISLTLLL